MVQYLVGSLLKCSSSLEIVPLHRKFLRPPETAHEVQLTRLEVLVQSLQAPTFFVRSEYPSAIQWTSTVLATTLIDYSGLTGDHQYFPNFIEFFSKQPVLHLRFQKYDDKLWVALTYLRGAKYAAIHDPKWIKPFLKRAQSFYKMAMSGWDNTSCGGGMVWGQGSKYKNAVTTELWITASMCMYEVFKEENMLHAAIRGWVWFRMSGMINEEGLVNDGLDNDCRYIS